MHFKSYLLRFMVVVAFAVAESLALECYVCDYEDGQFGRPSDCENNPGREHVRTVPAHPPNANPGYPRPPVPDFRFSARYLQATHGSQGIGGGNQVWFPYCVTIVGFRDSRKVVYRDFAWADTPNNDGQCELSMPTNYENLDLTGSKACYCNRMDGCNNEPTSDLSDLSCYDCFWYEVDGYIGSSQDCLRNPGSDKLAKVPRAPQMRLRSSYEMSKILDPKAFDMYKRMQPRETSHSGRQNVWVPYCFTLKARVHDKEILIRGAHWWEDESKDGYCDSDFPLNTGFRDNVGFNRSEYSDISMCYCSKPSGCNNKSGRETGAGTTNTASSAAVAVSVLIFLMSFV